MESAIYTWGDSTRVLPVAFSPNSNLWASWSCQKTIEIGYRAGHPAGHSFGTTWLGSFSHVFTSWVIVGLLISRGRGNTHTAAVFGGSFPNRRLCCLLSLWQAPGIAIHIHLWNPDSSLLQKVSIMIALIPHQWHSLPVAGAWDSIVQQWSMASNTQKGGEEYIARPVTLVLSSPECQLALAICYSEDCGPLFMWKTSSGTPQHTLSIKPVCFQLVAMSLNFKLVASGSDDYKLNSGMPPQANYCTFWRAIRWYIFRNVLAWRFWQAGTYHRIWFQSTYIVGFLAWW